MKGSGDNFSSPEQGIGTVSFDHTKKDQATKSERSGSERVSMSSWAR